MRSMIGAIGALCVVTSVAAAQTDPPAMFRGGPAHTGVYPGGSRAFAGLAWRVMTGGQVISTPVVAGTMLYVGSGDGKLYALDRRTGLERWHLDVGAPIHSSPGIAGGLIYVGARDNTFYGVDALSGHQVWRVQTGPDVPLPWGHESGDVYTSSPTVVGDVVLFGSGAGAVYAVDATSGNVRWRVRTAGRVRGTPAVVDGTVYVGDTDGVLYAIDLASGTERWRYETEGHALRSERFGFDRRTIQSSPAVSGGRVFVGARDGFLYAVDAGDGRLAWRFDHKVSWVNSSPAVVDGVVLAGSSDGEFVQAVDAASGSERWRATTDGIVWASPAVAGRYAYFATRSGIVYALDRVTGQEAWHYRCEPGFFSSPVIADSTLYIGSLDGSVLALRLTNGPSLHRAVYWDDSLANDSWYRGATVRDRLVEKGYALLDGAALAAFMNTRIEDGEPSTVVFTIDHLPDAATRGAGPATLLRRYLAAGGRAVWLGLPPLIWPRDTNAEISLADIDRDATTALLDVDHGPGNFDRWGTHATAAGRRWDLPEWWQASWAADPQTVTTVLGLDETGAAASWVKSYGPAGGAFVRLWDARAQEPDPALVQFAAEYRPWR
jgi:outer membrane protein assembly factor BamB